MSKQFTKAHQHADGGLHFQVLLDTTQVLPDGSPNPIYLREWDYGPAPKGWTSGSLNGTAYTDWPSYCAAEVQLLADAEAAQSAAPVTLNPPQGTTFG